MTPTVLSFIYIAYALALAGGGYMGYHKAHSVQSLVGSGIFAVLAIVAGILLRQNLHNGLMLGIETTMLVIGLFLFRYMLTGSPMPAFPAIGMSVIVLALSLMVLSANKALLKPPASEAPSNVSVAR